MTTALNALAAVLALFTAILYFYLAVNVGGLLNHVTVLLFLALAFIHSNQVFNGPKSAS